MKVALLNPVFWPEVRRGSERFARELADGLQARGHDVVLITSAARPSHTVEDGLEIVRVWRPPVEDRLRRRLFEDHLAHLPFARRALRAAKPDVAHALYPTDAVAALSAGVAPVVFSYMGIPHRVSLANRRLRKELVVRACRESAATVALSELAADGFRRWLGVDPNVVAPGVDLDVFAPDGHPRSDEPTVLCAADASQPRKRVELLREAVSRLDGVRLQLDGDPIVLDDRAVLAQANRRAWVHALPSVGEAFGLVLAEALACGTPVVGPQAEVVGEEDGTGVLFTGEDPGDLAQALRRALDLAADPATAARCRQRAERWSVDACAAAYERIYLDARRQP
jgi:glycosyltransferase involved in cell wall biosynthesis